MMKSELEEIKVVLGIVCYNYYSLNFSLSFDFQKYKLFARLTTSRYLYRSQTTQVLL